MTSTADGHSAPRRLSARELRLLFVVAGAVVFFDTVFYAAVVPLLPSLTRELHLSKASAGLLTAGYAVGTLVGSLPAGVLAERAGPRVTLYTGLVLMGSSSLAFGLLNDVALLDLARFVQGVGGACTWAGSMLWLILETPLERRGSAIGGALAAGIGGALFGPVVGTLAHALGRGQVFSAVVLVAAGLGVAVAMLPRPPEPEFDPSRAPLTRQVRRPDIALGMWLVAIPAVASGAINVLGPLRLGELGAGAAAIGATFLIAAAVEASMSPAVGRLSDRRGRMLPLRIGLGSAAVTLVLFTLPETALLLAVVIVLDTVALGTFWAPAMAMLSDAADSHGMSQGFALALVNFAWAAGQIAGAAGGGALAKSAGDGVPFALAAALCAGTLVLLLLRPAQRRILANR
ncbi:MAG TPA: MFS transporter [Solirubrobacteraceae bacterium]|nr:MFS transporter [Solirubrobacteraceae bacterium]